MDMFSRIYHATCSPSPSHTPSPMEQLPQDILVLILQSIESLRSLRAAVLASSAMNDAFRTAKIETLARVVSRSRPEEVNSAAVALSVFMHMSHGPKSKIAKALLNDNLQRPRQEWLFLPKSLSSPEFLHFHWYVEYFTEKLFKASMRHVHQRGWAGSEKLRFRRLSCNETIRIQRALYRLELFSLDADLEPMNYSRLKESAYWRKLVPVWELEEIACIQNLIFHRLAVVDNVIQGLLQYTGLLRIRRPEPGRNKTWLEITTRTTKSLLMCHNLSTLFRILTEPGQQSTRRIIHQTIREHFLEPMSPRCTEFLLQARGSILVSHFMFAGRETEQGATLPLERLRTWEESPRHPSYGYTHAYRSTTIEMVEAGYMHRKQSMLYNEAKHHEDRKWGYCLWDEERMEFWGEEFASFRTRSQLRVTRRGSPGWTTTRLN